MANKRREENRKRSAGGERMEEESGNRSGGWSGSEAHTERKGKHGEAGATGAGELTMAGPGRMAARITPHGVGMEVGKGTPPKGMKRYTEE